MTDTVHATDYAARRWVTLGASTLAGMCCGFYYAWSVLVKPMMEMYGWTSSDVALAFTLVVALPSVMALLAGKLLQYMRPPTLLLVAGAILAAGTVLLSFATSLPLLYAFAFVAGVGGMTYPGATMSNLMRFFPDKRGLASGVLTGGFGLGAVIWGPITVSLMDLVGLQWTLRLLGALFLLIIVVCSRLLTVAPEGYLPVGWKPPAPAARAGAASRAAGAVDRDWRAMLKAPSFWALFLVFVIGLTSGLMVTAHASPIAQKMLGISPGAAGAFVSYLAIGMVVGKVGWGALSDRVGRRPVLVTMLVLAVAALFVLWQSATYLPVVAGIFVVGTCYGGFLALIGPVTSDAFGPKHFSVNFGIMFLAVAVGSYAGPRLAAAVAEANGGGVQRGVPHLRRHVGGRAGAGRALCGPVPPKGGPGSAGKLSRRGGRRGILRRLAGTGPPLARTASERNHRANEARSRPGTQGQGGHRHRRRGRSEHRTVGCHPAG